MQDESLFTPGSIIPLSPESGIIQPLPTLPEQVHMVAHGKYEDYRVAAVFTTKEKDEAYVAAQNKYWKEKGGFDFCDEFYYDDTLDLDPSPSPSPYEIHYPPEREDRADRKVQGCAQRLVALSRRRVAHAMRNLSTARYPETRLEELPPRQRPLYCRPEY